MSCLEVGADDYLDKSVDAVRFVPPVRGGKELGGFKPGLVRHEPIGIGLVPQNPGVRLLLTPRGVTGHN
jgi:hypothetical protein